MRPTVAAAMGRRHMLAGVGTLASPSAGATAARAQTAQESAVTAIDIALEPDDIMIKHAQAANARLRQDFPNGFALDATHNPHVTLLQQFVRTADLEQLYAAAGSVFGEEAPLSLTTPLICQTGPKTSANSGCSCSMREKRCISGRSLASGIVGIRS